MSRKSRVPLPAPDFFRCYRIIMGVVKCKRTIFILGLISVNTVALPSSQAGPLIASTCDVLVGLTKYPLPFLSSPPNTRVAPSSLPA